MTDTVAHRSPATAMAEAARFLAGPAPVPGTERGSASDLSIDGVLLLGSIGWEAVELVTGISWYSIPRGSWVFGKGENETVTKAHQLAVAAAEQQITDQCARAGGHGVVGVRLEIKTERRHVAVELVGTAVRPIGAGVRDDRPFTSDLSARDFTVLTRSGWRPVGLSVGLSFVFVSWRRRSRRSGPRRGSYELANYTKALYDAREQAMERMQAAALELAATGIIGTTVTEGPVPFATHALSFVATGTATVLASGAHLAHKPTMVLPFDDARHSFEARSLRED